MRLGDRVLLIVAMLLCIAVCGYLFAIIWNLLPLQGLVQVLYDIADAWYYRIGVSALLLLLFLGFAKLMFVRVGSKQVLLQEGIAINQAGDVRISVEAIRQMCEQVAKKDSRIELASCTVQSTNQGLSVAIKAHSKGEQYIPGIVETIQQNIVKMLKDTCGITNAKVQILVEKADISQSGAGGAAGSMKPNVLGKPSQDASESVKASEGPING